MDIPSKGIFIGSPNYGKFKNISSSYIIQGEKKKKSTGCNVKPFFFNKEKKGMLFFIVHNKIKIRLCTSVWGLRER